MTPRPAAPDGYVRIRLYRGRTLHLIANETSMGPRFTACGEDVPVESDYCVGWRHPDCPKCFALASPAKDGAR
jgi:hypothetical protein